MSAKTEIIDTGLSMARIGKVRAMDGLQVEIVWAEGNRADRTEVIDLSPVVATYKVFRPLRNDPELFSSVRLIEDGDAIAWDGPDLEMSAEHIETLADTIMTPADFAAFMKRNGLTQEAAAAVLGRSRRQIAYYLSTGPVPRVVALACYGYECLQDAQTPKVA